MRLYECCPFTMSRLEAWNCVPPWRAEHGIAYPDTERIRIRWPWHRRCRSSTWPVARQASIGATPTRLYASGMIVLGLTTYVVRIATTEASARSRWAVGTASCTDLVER